MLVGVSEIIAQYCPVQPVIVVEEGGDRVRGALQQALLLEEAQAALRLAVEPDEGGEGEGCQGVGVVGGGQGGSGSGEVTRGLG